MTQKIEIRIDDEGKGEILTDRSCRISCEKCQTGHLIVLLNGAASTWTKEITCSVCKQEYNIIFKWTTF